MARFTITLSDDMHKRLKEQAERDRRTLGQEIAYLLELYVPAYQSQNNSLSSTPTSMSTSTPENPEGRPIITNDFNSYYRPTTTISAPRRQIIE